MTVRRPAQVLSPGEHLKEELDERGWSQTDLANILGRPQPLVHELLAGKRAITPETAAGLAAAFGTTPEMWLKLEVSYQLSRLGTTQDHVSRRAKLYGLAPIHAMALRGWITEPKNPNDPVELDALESQVKRFFAIPDLDTEPYFAVAAHKSTPGEAPLTPAQRAWSFRAKHLARALHVGRYSPDALDDAVERLKLLMREPAEIRHVPRVLAEAGVRFLVVEPFPGSRIDGASFWLEDGSPVVVLALRFDRIDNFWFVLLHELGHIRRGDGAIDVDIQEEGDTSALREPERDANAFASETLVPGAALDSFIRRKSPAYTNANILAFATVNGIHPGIVVGQLHHRSVFRGKWASFRNVLVPIRKVVTSSALTDGWGAQLPAMA